MCTLKSRARTPYCILPRKNKGVVGRRQNRQKPHGKNPRKTSLRHTGLTGVTSLTFSLLSPFSSPPPAGAKRCHSALLIRHQPAKKSCSFFFCLFSLSLWRVSFSLVAPSLIFCCLVCSFLSAFSLCWRARLLYFLFRMP
jgi:hypothetical protein